MLEQIARWNAWLNGYVWRWPTIVLLLGTGVLLTIATRGAQFRCLGLTLTRGAGQNHAKGTRTWKRVVVSSGCDRARVDRRRRQHRRVATAIAVGGPGALFWLWISGVLGMCTKFAEIVIALHYREQDASGVWEARCIPFASCDFPGWDPRSRPW